MEKILEKRNLGIPVVILTLAAYYIGYSITVDYSSLLVAVLFAAIVFIFNFDEKVRFAVKQSYLIAFLFGLLYLGFDVLYQLSNFTTAGYALIFLQALGRVHTYGLILLHIAVIVIYFIFILGAVLKKEIKFGFLFGILGEARPKPQTTYQQPTHQPMYQQPMPQPMYQQPGAQPMYQQPGVQPMHQQPIPQAMYQQPVPQPMMQPGQSPLPQGAQPKEQQGILCSNCGTPNQFGAQFCKSCGAKLNQ